MNKKGGLVFSLIIFLILWALFFAKWISNQGQAFINQYSLTGLEAFLIGNMNIWILAGLIIGFVMNWAFGGNN